ncbi:AbfB domain-containing protein [Nonomuraea sp. B19D2]|uniref:AbfB domain-containing protein n=1 Tax=Nonomuraea sp. B19D2 TaxID=3159561 RepID=UPI0032DA8FC5
MQGLCGEVHAGPALDGRSVCVNTWAPTAFWDTSRGQYGIVYSANNGSTYGARSTTGAPNSYTTYTSGLRQGNAIEAPLLIKNNAGTGWWLWGDSFSPVNNDYYAWSTSNVGGNAWTALNQRTYTPPLNAEHGSIAGISAAEYNGLVSRWGVPNWVRLKSSNLPDRFVRHADFALGIDPLSSSSSAGDRQDATFRVTS